jgi:hypothetical protein
VVTLVLQGDSTALITRSWASCSAAALLVENIAVLKGVIEQQAAEIAALEKRNHDTTEELDAALRANATRVRRACCVAASTVLVDSHPRC